MRKRAMVIGLLLVPLATGGAVLLAKGIHQSKPGAKATITLPSGESAPSEYSPSEGSGFVLAPSDSNAETRDLKQQQSEEQQKREAPKTPSSEDVDSDHAAAEVLFASENESAETADGSAPAISSPRDFFNSYAFANSRRSAGTGGSSATGQSSGSASSADTKTPQSSSTTESVPGQQSSEPQNPDSDGASGEHGDSNTPHEQGGPTETQVEAETGNDADHGTEHVTPPQVTPVPYFPPDDRPHVTVPEPSTLMLLGLGLLACAAASRRRRVKVK